MTSLFLRPTPYQGVHESGRGIGLKLMTSFVDVPLPTQTFDHTAKLGFLRIDAVRKQVSILCQNI